MAHGASNVLVGIVLWVEHHSSIGGFYAEGRLLVWFASSIGQDYQRFSDSCQRDKSWFSVLQILEPPLEGPFQFQFQRLILRCSRVCSSAQIGEGNSSHATKGLRVGEDQFASQLCSFRR